MKVSLELTAEQIGEIAVVVAERLMASGVPCAVSAEKRRKPYTAVEAAEALGVSKDTIYRMVVAGRLGRVPGSAVVRIPVGEVERLLEGKC